MFTPAPGDYLFSIQFAMAGGTLATLRNSGNHTLKYLLRERPGAVANNGVS